VEHAVAIIRRYADASGGSGDVVANNATKRLK